MTACVVTEGQFDGKFIEELLKYREAKPPRVFVANGSSSAESLAKSLLGVKQLPVAIILDADEHDASKVEEYRDYMEAMLGTTAPKSSWEVILMIPEIEIVFFQIPGLIANLGLPAPSPVELERAKHQPKKVLLELIAKTTKRPSSQATQWLMGRFKKLPHNKIWRLDPFVRLQQFLERHDSEAPTLDSP